MLKEKLKEEDEVSEEEIVDASDEEEEEEKGDFKNEELGKWQLIETII